MNMKKLVFVLILLFAATALFAQSVDLEKFPKGRWLDANWDAIWEISATGIKLTTTDGTFTYTFNNGNMQGFKFTMSGIQPAVTFSCADTERTYLFRAALPATDVVMEIERSGKPKYSVTMKKQ